MTCQSTNKSNNPYLLREKESKPDCYYRQKSREAIETAISQSKGKTPVEIRHAIRRNYPFGNGDRGGREYKIWNSLVLETEIRLGLPKQTKAKVKKIPNTNLSY